jgi:hypothetical protein
MTSRRIMTRATRDEGRAPLVGFLYAEDLLGRNELAGAVETIDDPIIEVGVGLDEPRLRLALAGSFRAARRTSEA